MGWTSYYAERYKNGKIDRRAECDHIFRTELNAAKTHMLTLLKSAMVGSTYYAAIEIKSISDESDREVFAVVCLTSTKDGEFYYKDMTETCCPCEQKCPKSILKLLTPTENEYANKWRKGCEEYHSNKKNSPNNLPVGTKIKCTIGGKEKILLKHPAAYQFKTPFWYDGKGYIPKSRIPKNYEIVE